MRAAGDFRGASSQRSSPTPALPRHPVRQRELDSPSAAKRMMGNRVYLGEARSGPVRQTLMHILH
jgi:hypothetical protein